jgi:uncharacterized protein YkwD
MRPHLSLILAAAVCFLALALLTGTSAAQTPAPAAPAAPTTIYLPLLAGRSGLLSAEEQAMATEVLALVNAERAKLGCGPLSLSEQLTAAAYSHSKDMAQNNFFSHTGSAGTTVSQRALAAGYASSYIGENIAAGYTSPEEVMSGWMESDGHRKNILNCAYVHIGIGYVHQTDDAPLAGASWPYYRYWTQVFGAPR